MKYTININCESESLEKDIDSLVNTLMGAYERYKRIEKETEPEGVEIPSEELEEVKAEVKGLDNRIDGLEAKIDSFCEVDIKKRVKPETK